MLSYLGFYLEAYTILYNHLLYVTRSNMIPIGAFPSEVCTYLV